MGDSLHIPILSDILGFPVERGKLIVGLYEPSTQWLSLLLTIAARLLRDGYVVGIATLSTPPSMIRRRLTTELPDLNSLETAKRFTIVDWYTWMTGTKSTERRSVDSLKLAEFNVQDSKYQRDDSAIYDFLAIDNLSTFLKYNDEHSFMQWLDKTVARMKELKGVRLYGFAKRFHSDAFYANVETLADGVIELENRERAGKLENTIRVKSMKTFQHPTGWRTLKMTDTGFIRLTGMTPTRKGLSK